MQRAAVIRAGLFVGVAVLVAVFADPAAASGGVDCANAVNQNDMNTCAAQSFDAADAKLNAVYRALTSKLEDKDKTQLKTAQRAWLTFRDAECTFSIRENEGGSIYPMLWSGCLEQRTKARTKELQAHLDCANGKDSCTE